MLQGIRDRSQSWLMWIIVILIIMTFALWGVQQYITPEVNVAVAKVNGEELTLRQFQEAYQRQRLRLQSLLGANFDLSQLDETRLKRETLNRMINDELVLQSALENGLRIGDGQLANSIRALDVFKVEGRFSQAQYENWLGRQGEAPGSFEYSYRRSLLDTQLRMGVVESAIVTDAELDNAIRLQEQKRTFAYLVIPASRFEDSVTVTDEAVKTYYDTHRGAFANPEQVQVEYLELSRSAIAETITLSDEELERRYEAQKANYITSGQRRASHILIELPEGPPAEQESEALEKAKSLKGRIDSGESFEALAEAHSDDSGSAQQGGDLGFFGKGVMDAPFEDAVFSMEEGEISEPIRSSFGFHVIKVTGIRPAETKPFAEVKERVRRELQLEKAEQRFFDQAEQLANLAFENPDNLEVAAEALELEVMTSGFFGRGGDEGIAKEPRVARVAFGEDVLVQGNNSEPLELSGGRIVVLRVKEHTPASDRPLDEVREEITRRLRTERMRAMAAEKGTGALERLRSGVSPEALGNELDLDWTTLKEAGRTVAAVERAVLEQAFQLARPASGQPVFGGVVLAAGDYGIIALTEVKDGDPGATDKGLRDALRANLGRSAGQEVYQSFVQGLRAKADVVMFAEQLP